MSPLFRNSRNEIFKGYSGHSATIHFDLKWMYIIEKVQAKRLLKRGQDYDVSERKPYLGSNKWCEITFVYERKENSERTEYRQYAVFVTNAPAGAVGTIRITGRSKVVTRVSSNSWLRSVVRQRLVEKYSSPLILMNPSPQRILYTHELTEHISSTNSPDTTAATTLKDFVLRFFYFAFACLLYSIWRVIDLHVQVALNDEYEHSPIVTAQNTLTLLQKQTGVG